MPRGVSIRLLRSLAAGNLPPVLEQGELALDALNDPPRLYTGVPFERDASGRIDLLAGAGGGGGGASVTVSATPPSSPSPGNLWFDSVSLQMFIRYFDGTTHQWVPVSQAGGGGGAGGGLTMGEVMDEVAGTWRSLPLNLPAGWASSAGILYRSLMGGKILQISGAMSGTSAPITTGNIANLPVGYRPSRIVFATGWGGLEGGTGNVGVNFSLTVAGDLNVAPIDLVGTTFVSIYMDIMMPIGTIAAGQ